MEIKISNYELLLLLIATGCLAFIGFLILCFYREHIIEGFSSISELYSQSNLTNIKIDPQN